MEKNKMKVYGAFIILGLFAVLAFFGYYKSAQYAELTSDYNILSAEKEDLKTEINEFDLLKQKIQNERNTCKEVLSKEDGNFAEFSYCQKFITFSEE